VDRRGGVEHTERVRVRAGGPGDLDILEPLWVAVHHQHSATMPELAPYVDDATTWAERRALYAELLAKPDTVLLVAEDDGGAAVGYGLAHVMERDSTWLADTWVTGARVGEIESLSVLPAHRGAGLGTALLDELEAALAARGVTDLILGVLPGNSAALRLYERRGWQPTWLYLSRFDGRHAD
jgi:ribosomal protein S18 acetylase RimI-like enzyme